MAKPRRLRRKKASFSRSKARPTNGARRCSWRISPHRPTSGAKRRITGARWKGRSRSLAAIEHAFQAQILTALPRVRRPIVGQDGVPAPSRLLREPLRRLQVGVTLAPSNTLGDGGTVRPISLLFVSADPGDGKST